MTTAYNHKPVLTYKETFDEKDGADKVKIHNRRKSQYQRVLQGNIEDLLWTIGAFKSKEETFAYQPNQPVLKSSQISSVLDIEEFGTT